MISRFVGHFLVLSQSANPISFVILFLFPVSPLMNVIKRLLLKSVQTQLGAFFLCFVNFMASAITEPKETFDLSFFFLISVEMEYMCYS